MKVYIAASTADQALARECAKELIKWGHESTAHWIDQNDVGAAESSRNRADCERLSGMDLADIDAAQVMIVLDPEKCSTGKHFETGYAHAKGMKIFLAGKPKSVFHYRPGMIHCLDFEAALRSLRNICQKCYCTELVLRDYSMMWHDGELYCANCGEFVRSYDAG